MIFTPEHPLRKRAAELVKAHGGVRPAARVLQTDPGHFKRILDGQKEPSKQLARRMGLRKITVYEQSA